MADDLLRSKIGDPSIPFATGQPAVKTDKTSAAFSQLAALGAAGIQTYQKEHEVGMTRKAMNDVVNNTVNADIKQHEAAYAITVAKGQAIKGFNSLSEEIKDGKYNDIEPEDFQKFLNERHKDYKSTISKEKFSTAQAAQYDEFWLKNEAAITAGQAGKYRLGLGMKQMQTLNEQLSDLVTATVVPSADDIIQVASSPDLTLIDDDSRITSMLIAGIDLARENPEQGLTVLQELNSELHFNTDPKRYAAYATATKTARKDIVKNRNSFSAQNTYNIIKSVDEIEQTGYLTDDHYPLVKDSLDANGKQIFTPKQFKAKVNNSSKIRAGNTVLGNIVTSIKTGVNAGGKPKDFTAATDQIYIQELAAAKNDSVVALENMGRMLAKQDGVWTPLKDRMSMFDRELLVKKNGEVNKDAMRRYKEIAAVERGMSADNRGKATFADYMGDSLTQYRVIQEALTLTKDSEDGAWISVAEDLKMREETAKKHKWVSSLSTNAKAFGNEIAESIWQTKNKWYVPDVIENLFIPDKGEMFDRISNLVAKVYDNSIQQGWGVDKAKEDAETAGHSQMYMWAGELYDTHGKPPSIIFGTSDPEGAVSTMVNDPEWGAKIFDAFGVTFGEMFFGGYDTPVTEKDILKHEKRIKGKRTRVRKVEIHKTIDMDAGLLRFKSSRDGGTTFAIPLRAIGAAHEASLQNTEDIDRLERLYDTGFQGTEAGKQWAAEQEILNDTFLNNILSDNTDTTSTEYADMTQIEQTRTRLQYAKDTYKGISGKIDQLIDFFKLKRDTGSEPVYYPLSDPVKNVTGGAATTFKDEVKLQENKHRVGRGKDGLWQPHVSKEGGRETIGYGHKLSPTEAKSGVIKIGTESVRIKDGLTDTQISDLFEQDWAKHRAIAAKKWKGFHNLTTRDQEIITELSFNVKEFKQSKWKKLTKAMDMPKGIKRDKAISKEISRTYTKSGIKIPLTKRVTALRKAAGLPSV